MRDGASRRSVPGAGVPTRAESRCAQRGSAGGRAGFGVRPVPEAGHGRLIPALTAALLCACPMDGARSGPRADGEG